VRLLRIAFRATTPRGVINVIRRRTSRHGAAITRQAVQGTRTTSFDASLTTGTTSAAREGCFRSSASLNLSRVAFESRERRKMTTVASRSSIARVI
jgi:broad specificity polyphosphatase/5'/3'-nucleotidase SurE